MNVTERLLALALVAACNACRPAEQSDPGAELLNPVTPPSVGVMPVRGLLQEYYSGLRDSTRRIITDDAALSAAWAQAHLGRSDVPAIPTIDFGSEMVVVVAMGTRSSGGYSIHVDSARATDAGVEVFVRSVAPGLTCGTTGALTQPAVMAALPRSTARVSFVERSQRSDCD